MSQIPQSPQPRVQRIDLVALQTEAAAQQRAGAIGSLVGADLNVNLVRLAPDESVAAHTNTEVDVLLVGISGAGVVELEAGDEPLDAGSALYVPKNVRRGIRAGNQGVVYLTCHRRRGGLMPTPRRAPQSH
ncbi:MAG TPA: cupin domain-containing protein [Ktedonobacterales bacterium]